MKARTLVAVLVLVGCPIALLNAQDESAENGAAAVKQANAQFYEALSAMFTGDVAPMEAVWSHADDVTYLGPDRSFLIGWEATLKDWRRQAAMNLGGQVQPRDVHVNVGRDLAVVHNLEVGKNEVRGEALTVNIRATNVYRHENGQWKMIGHHVDLLPIFNE